MYEVKISGLEEAQHPFYIIQFTILHNGKPWLESAGRYVHTNEGGKMQFLEPDLKKMQTQPNAPKLIEQVEQTVLAEGQRLAQEKNT